MILRILIQSGQFADACIALLISLAVLGNVGGLVEARAFAETVAADAIDFQFEIKPAKRVFSSPVAIDVVILLPKVA